MFDKRNPFNLVNKYKSEVYFFNLDRYEEMEPTYLRQLKKMRNDHLSNIVLEVKKLKELLRYSNRMEILDRRRKK